MLYKTGTVSVTTGSYVVTGSGTSWASLALPLVFGTEAGGSYECSRIVSNTVLWLSEPYVGATATGVSYKLSNSFTAVYSFPFTTPKDARQADTLSSFLIAAEKKLVELNGGVPVSGQRLQQYTAGTALLTSGSTTVTGYNTSWSTVPITTDGSVETYFYPTNLWPSYMYNTGYWPGDEESTAASCVYLKRRGELTVYTVSSITDDTHLVLSSAYSPEDASIAAYDDGSSYALGSLVTFDGSIWRQVWGAPITDIQPVADYDSSSTYRYSNTVLEDGTRYFCISETDIDGTAPPEGSVWRICVDADFDNAKYWKLFKGYEYQIVYSTTENYDLPILVTGALDKWFWFRKATQLLDTYL